MMYTLLYADRTFKNLLFISSGMETAKKKRHSRNGMKNRARTPSYKECTSQAVANDTLVRISLVPRPLPEKRKGAGLGTRLTTH